MIRMSAYFKTSLGVRVIAASFMGLVSVIGGIAITLLALAFVDAGSDLSPAVSLGFVLGAPFGAAIVITRTLTTPPSGWSAFFVGLGGCAGLLLGDLLAPMLPGYPMNHQAAGIAMTFGLPFVGAFLGTYVPAPKPRSHVRELS
jgi:hypothetical protein